MKKIFPKIILVLIIILYSVISFYKLGSTKNPQTFLNLKNRENITYKLDTENIPSELIMYIGPNRACISIFLATEFGNYDTYDYDVSKDTDNSILCWQKISINNLNKKYSYIMIQSYYDTTIIGEIKLLDVNNNEINLIPMEEKANLLIDEQDCIPEKFSYMNNAYFDEIYFARTAYEICNNLPIYEWTHPHLGKLIIALSIKLFGFTPFAYRVMGNIAGIFMLLVVYEIVKTLFKNENYGVFATLIFALDGMHFVQTRIGTTDSFLVLFCLLSFLFFIKFIEINDNLKKQSIMLLLSGLFWGMAISVKWAAFFCGLGMGIIYFANFLYNTVRTKKFNWKLILISIISFIIIPIIVYIISYIPIIKNPNSGITDIKSFIKYQQNMYEYHSTLDATHPFTSQWYSWPVIQKPVWYYFNALDNGNYETISCMGNPAIWWISIVTAIFTLIYSLIKKDKVGIILIIMIVTTWCTYAFIGRIMFLYHYFITLPFMIFTIVFCAKKIVGFNRFFKFIIPILIILFLVFFIYFYPVYSAKESTPNNLMKKQWFNSWIWMN